MNKIIIVRTPYQLIVSIYIKEQFCKKTDLVDLIITETFNNYDKVKEKLEILKIFNNIMILSKNKISYLEKKGNVIKKIKLILNPNFMTNTILKNLKVYDELYFWNYDVITECLRSFLVKKNLNIKCFMFEEGYISYFPVDEIMTNSKTLKMLKIRNKFFKIPNITFNSIDGYLLFNPELSIYKTSVPKFRIYRDSINYSDIMKNIKYIFNVTDRIVKQYDKKFIIFEEAMFSNSNEFDDEKVILDIVKKVGKENVLIKLHPRTKVDRFSKLGIKTLGADGIPWEAITLIGNFSNNVFIAICSGSIINYRLTFGKKMKGILLFKIVKPHLEYMSSKYDEFWKMIESKYPEGGIYIPSAMDELNKILENIEKEESDKE